MGKRNSSSPQGRKRGTRAQDGAPRKTRKSSSGKSYGKTARPGSASDDPLTSRPRRGSGERSYGKTNNRFSGSGEQPTSRPRRTSQRKDHGSTGRPYSGDEQTGQRPRRTSSGKSYGRAERPETGKPKREGPRKSGKSFGSSRGEKSGNYGLPYKRKSSSRRTPEESGEENHGFFSKPRRGPSRGTSGRSKKNEPQDLTGPQTSQIRLNRYIANSGVCSRREADELIAMGLVTVNGKTVTEMGYKVNPGDEVRYENKILKAEKPVYVLMNKPKGYLTTTDDPQERNTVMHILGSAIKERIYPVGRLDRNTTGLLLLTNDGDLAEKLMHPSYNIKKIYKVELDRPLTKADFQKISEGVMLEEGRAKVDDIAIVSPDGKTIGIELHIGWNRVVRRIFEALGYQVERLDRTVYAGLDKKTIGRGEWRFLTREEIVRLKHYQ